MTMTELERRALLGDKDTQEECTEKGILLPCPFCESQPTVKVQKVEYGLSGTIIRCSKCGAYLYSPDKKAKITELGVNNVPIADHTKIGVSRWNTRPAPPIGRCGECANATHPGENIVRCEVFDRDMMPDDFCSQFEVKGEL